MALISQIVGIMGLKCFEGVEANAAGLREWLGENAIRIIDRGNRDVLRFLLKNLGIDYKMSALLEQEERQLETAYVNDSRLITKSRWIVEA